MRKPAPLYPGARVALVCASSAVPADRLESAVAAVKELMLQPVVYPTCRFDSRHGYFAGSDAQRSADLNAAFADDSIDGILAIRGGYGANRILPLLDWDTIRAHPKFFAGYSDVTALHIAFNQTGDFMTYHTIMPSTEYYEPVDGYSRDYLLRALYGRLTGPLENPPDQSMVTLVPGQAAGRLCGGNLSLVRDSLGTPWEIDTRGKLLFLEDIGEKTYRVDGMLTQLRNAGKLDQCAGILLGAWTDCTPEYPNRCLELREIFEELIVPAGKPAVMNLACGHALPSMSLPLGASAFLDAGAHLLEVR